MNNSPLAGDGAGERLSQGACRGEEISDALVLAADTLVYLDRGHKAVWQARASRRRGADVGRITGRVHAVITGVCLLHLRSHQQRVFAEWTDVRFHPLTAQQIEDYLALMNPLDKAGARHPEHGERIVAEISASFSNVVGCRWNGCARNCASGRRRPRSDSPFIRRWNRVR